MGRAQRNPANDADIHRRRADGIGDDAYWRDGHLFVLAGTTQLDIYSRGGDDNQNQAEAEKVAGVLLPKVREFS